MGERWRPRGTRAGPSKVPGTPDPLDAWSLLSCRASSGRRLVGHRRTGEELQAAYDAAFVEARAALALLDASEREDRGAWAAAAAGLESPGAWRGAHEWTLSGAPPHPDAAWSRAAVSRLRSASEAGLRAAESGEAPAGVTAGAFMAALGTRDALDGEPRPACQRGARHADGPGTVVPFGGRVPLVHVAEKRVGGTLPLSHRGVHFVSACASSWRFLLHVDGRRTFREVANAVGGVDPACQVEFYEFFRTLVYEGVLRGVKAPARSVARG
jgi:hypothetical protein